MMPFGFYRVAAAVPTLTVADPQANSRQMLALLQQAHDRDCDAVLFPECALTGYTAGDLFHQSPLLRQTERALHSILEESTFPGVIIVGFPVVTEGKVFNAAAVLQAGKLLGVVPKTYLPNYKEFYDARYFAPARASRQATITLAGHTVPFGTDILFADVEHAELILGLEICEDLWMPIPPSSEQALAGATVLFNLSASNETIGKAAYRRQLVAGQSARCIAGYVYASSGVTESTTDLVFGGHALIAENGNILAEGDRFQREATLTVADLDLERLRHDRLLTNSFHDGPTGKPYRRIAITTPRSIAAPKLARSIDPHPFVPSDPATRADRCQDIFQTQVHALAKRLEVAGRPVCTIG
ncbi:MAG: nitrilase-related carbon-nitrogen hydrolase, partial [Gemmataceae bacterium]